MSGFLSKIPDTMSTGLDLMHYSRVAGYLDKPGNKRECGVMQDVRISCISATARAAVVSKISQLAKAIEDAEEKEENGVYTWMAFSSLDNDTGLRVFARYDGREAMERHLRTREVVEFWTESKDDVAQMESRPYFPNGKGWLHR